PSALFQHAAIVGAVLVGQMTREQEVIVAADELWRCSPEAAAERFVGGDETQLLVLEKHALRQVFDQRAILCLAGADGFLRASALGHIDKESANRRFSFPNDPAGGRLYPDE